VPSAGQTIEGRDGFRLELVRTEPDVLEMVATYRGDAPMAPMHLHPQQTERFEVLAGAIETVIDGTPRRYETGDVFEVPPGTPHQMGAVGPSRVNWQVRPALRTAEFFAVLHGGGSPTFLEDFAAELRLC
jgi:quercetin dioxygenase-like cupin family protein